MIYANYCVGELGKVSPGCETYASGTDTAILVPTLIRKYPRTLTLNDGHYLLPTALSALANIYPEKTILNVVLKFLQNLLPTDCGKPH